MSAAVLKMGDKRTAIAMAESKENTQTQTKSAPKHYRGFVAGVFSGIAKLSGTLPAVIWLRYFIANSRIVGHPFDTVKVRLQTTDKSQFRGPLDCLLQTVRKEGFAGLYKGATPPLVGWMFMDSMYVSISHVDSSS